MPESLGPDEPLVEREIKLRLASAGDETVAGGVSLVELRRRIVDSRAVLEHERALEDNFLFDRDGELRGRGVVLRLRSYGPDQEDGSPAATLTFKGPPSYQGDHKIREEVDLGCASGVAAAAFLEGLGYRKQLRYQKYREVWRLRDSSGVVEICLDETPIGDYVELELISRAANQDLDPIEVSRKALGLDRAPAERDSYPGLYADYCSRHPQAPANMVFGD